MRAQKRGGEERGGWRRRTQQLGRSQLRGGRPKRTEETRPLKKVRLEEEEGGGGGGTEERREMRRGGGRPSFCVARFWAEGKREGGRRVYTTYVWAAAEAEAEAVAEAVAEAAAAEMREEKETWGAFGSVFRPCDEATERTKNEEERLKVGRRKEGRLLSFSPSPPPSHCRHRPLPLSLLLLRTVQRRRR